MLLATNNCHEIIKADLKQCENIGLWFNFFTPVYDGKEEVKNFQTRGTKITENEKSRKAKYKPALLKDLPQTEIQELLQGFHERKCSFFKQLKSNNYAVKMVYVKSCSRVAVGMGNDHPSENGLSFQYPLGFPIIPGSTIKGITKHYVEMFCNHQKSDETIQRRIFGSNQNEGQQGSVMFFDAYPCETVKSLLEYDVMTPHYGKYYSSEGKNPPADYDSPNIIKFLTVPKDTAFYFQLSSQNKQDLDIAWEWFKKARATVGIGGKTNVGYGRFSKEEEEVIL
jgi:CRISPR-associated protein Cmr6